MISFPRQLTISDQYATLTIFAIFTFFFLKLAKSDYMYLEFWNI